MPKETKKKPKKEINLDFSGISGQRHKKELSPQPKEKQTVQNKDRDIILSIPTEDGKSWIQKDIGHVNGEEFLLWASSVYPGPIEIDPKVLDNVTKRMTVFKKILHYHVNSPFQTGKDSLGKEVKKEYLIN